MGVDCIWTTLIKVFDLLKIFIKQCQSARATPHSFTPTRFFRRGTFDPKRKVNDFKIDFGTVTPPSKKGSRLKRMFPDVRFCKFYFQIHKKHISF